MRSNRPALKLEALEQRQLLATIVGGTGGTEVGSDITVAGKVYDQILMTGSSIAVQADAGQIVRVDWMDADGDIVRAEYSGTGTLSISLASFAAAAAPTKYTGITTKYVTGLASFVITGSDDTSNFLTTSLGPVTAFNGLANPIFAAGTTIGGNSTANVARLVIVGDSQNPVTGSGSRFNSIFAGNAVFSDTSGIVGIYAPNTNFKSGGSITVGDVVPVGITTTPTLVVGAFSDVKTVTVAGGALKSASSGIAYQFTNVGTVVSTTGTNSGGTKVNTQTLSNAPAVVQYSSGLGTITIDGTTATTASLDALYKGSYLTDVVINGGLPSGVVFHALQFGNVTVNGNLQGILTTDVNDDNVSNTCEQGIGNVTINGDILDGGYIESAGTIGNVTVTGKVTHTTTAPAVNIGSPAVPTPNAIAVIGTLGKASQSAAIGNISFGGDVNIGTINGINNATSSVAVAESLIVANKNATALTAAVSDSLSTTVSIGTISGANLTVNSSANALAIISNIAVTAAGTNGVSSGGIGAITFTGDVNMTSATGGGIVSTRGIGAIQAKSLTISAATANVAAGVRPAGAIYATSNTASNGSIGNITTTGGNLTITAGQVKSTGTIGNISVNSTGNLTINGAVTAALGLGNINVDSGNMTNGATIATTTGNIGDITLKSGNLTVNAAITATSGNIGNITLTNTTGSETNANISATQVSGVGGAIGNITVTSGNLTVGNTAASLFSAVTTIGNITLAKGALTIGTTGTTSGFVAVNGTDFTGTSIGNVSVTGGGITGKTAQIEFQANKIGNVSVTPATGAAATVALTDVIFSAKGTTAASIGTASIGNITLDTSGNTNAGTSIAKSAAGSANNTGSGFSSSGNIGTITISANNAGKIINDAATTLLFRAGSSEMNAASNTTATGVALAGTNSAVSIGNVSIAGNLSAGGISAGKAATANGGVGVGLVINSGVDVATPSGGARTAGLWNSATNAAGLTAVITGTKLTNGTIGTVTLNDTNGTVARSAFNSGGVTEAADASNSGASIIVADTIGVVTVNTGVNILNITPTGNPLQGVVGMTAVATTTQVYTSADTNRLLVVVL